MFRSEETDGVDAVAEPAKRQRELNAEAVDEGAGEETDDGEGAVERYVLCGVLGLGSNCEKVPDMEMWFYVWMVCTWVLEAYHIISQRCVCLASAAQTAQRIEHARAQETHHGDHEELYLRRRIPGDDERADPALAVHPSLRQIGAAAGGGFEGGGFGRDTGSFGVGHGLHGVCESECSCCRWRRRCWRESRSCRSLGERRRGGRWLYTSDRVPALLSTARSLHPLFWQADGDSRVGAMEWGRTRHGTGMSQHREWLLVLTHGRPPQGAAGGEGWRGWMVSWKRYR